MSIEAYGLQDIKKELQHANSARLTELVLRLARYKKENKELLAYILFVADDEAAFIESARGQIGQMFYMLPSTPYDMTKGLRKVLRLITKLARFSASKPAEISLLLAFCANYVEFIDKRFGYKPLRTVFLRQVDKVAKLIAKQHEDLQGDYMAEYETVLEDADKKYTWFSKFEHLL